MSDIQHINLAAIDLNLLVVFDAVFAARHVTLAGRKIGLSQPATSNALSRLRHLFDDELFVKTSSGMQPTPKAVTLAEPIRQVLEQIQATLTTNAEFIPEVSERLFTIGMSDLMALNVLPKLMQSLEHIAPRVKIRVRSIDRDRGLQMIDADELDLAIGFFPKRSAWHQTQVLFQETFVGVCRQNHPIADQPITMETYLAASHLLVSPKEDVSGRVDDLLAGQNLKRQVALALPQFLAAPFAIAQTNLLATVPASLARTYADLLNLQIVPLPFELSGFAVLMLWHTKNQNDPAHDWLRQLIKNLNGR